MFASGLGQLRLQNLHGADSKRRQSTHPHNTRLSILEPHDVRCCVRSACCLRQATMARQPPKPCRCFRRFSTILYGDVPCHRPHSQPHQQTHLEVVVAVTAAAASGARDVASIPGASSVPHPRHFTPLRPVRANYGLSRQQGPQQPPLASSPPKPSWKPPPPGQGHGRMAASADGRAILIAIRNSETLDELLELLRNHEGDFNIRHLDAALDRLSRLAAAADADDGGDGGSSGFAAVAAARAAGARMLLNVLGSSAGASYDGAGTAVEAAAAALTPRDCASVLSALARLELKPPTDVAALLQGRLLAQLNAASVRDVAQLLHGSAKLRLGVAPGAVSELLRRLDGELAVAGKPQDVSMVLWSLASLELSSPPLEWIHRLTAQLPVSRLGTFTPQALSNSVWALARLGYQPGAVWLAAVVAASERRLESFTTPELVNLLWAFAVLRYMPGESWMTGTLGLLRNRAAGMSPQDVSTLCWSLAVLKVRPGLPLLQRLVARALSVRRAMGPQSLVNTLWGLSRLRVQLPERAVALLLQGGLGATALYGTSGTMTSSTAIIGSSGGSDVSSRGRYSRLSGAKAVLSAAAASPAELAGAALVLAHCRHVPPYSWLVRYCAAVARQLHLFGPRELSTLLYGIGRLGPMGLRVDSRWLDRLLAEVERMAAPPPPSPMQADSCTNPPGMALRHRLKLDVVAAAAVEHDYAGGGGGGGGAVFAILENRAAEAAVAAEVRQECAASAAVHSGLNSASTHLSSAVSPPPRRRQHDHDQLPGTERLSAAQLAILLWAVARLGHKPPGAWVAAMARQVAARLEEFEAREIATTIRALQELAPATAAPYSCCSDVRRRSRSGGKWRGKGHSVDTNGPSPCDNGSSDTSTSNDGSCGEAVAGLAIRLAAKLPERNLYSTLRAASLSYGSGMPYATIADQLITDVYSVRSLGLLQGGGADAGGEGKDEGGQERPNGHTGA